MKNLTCATKISLLFGLRILIGAGAIGLLLYHISALTAVYKRIDHDTVQSRRKAPKRLPSYQIWPWHTQ